MSGPQVYSGAPVAGAHLVKRGKVRDIYDGGPGQLLIVASDRISAFDVVLDPGIPDKGVVLTRLSSFWFTKLESVAPNHVLASRLADLPAPFAEHAELRGRACLVKAVRILPVECIVRGYLVGSGWKEYQASGTVCGIPLPAGLRQADRLPAPIFTPSTKAEEGHDENISFDRMVALTGGAVGEELRRLSLALYAEAGRIAEERGIIIADTKFEFGLDDQERIIWADEALTPDSSRFWDVATYRPGSNPPSFDKQFVRDWLEGTGWNKQPPAPPLPAEVASRTRELYLEAYRRLTDHPLDLTAD